MKIIVGLGNPGTRYASTRHNIGANAVKRLAADHGIALRRKRHVSRFGEGTIAGERVVLIVPETYMNRSGEAVSRFVRDSGIAYTELLVVSDGADLPLGRLRMRQGGSDGGHRGLRSIIEHIGSRHFPRLRIGIGRDGDLKDYVLSRFRKEEKETVNLALAAATRAIHSWIRDGIGCAMNRYNGDV